MFEGTPGTPESLLRRRAETSTSCWMRGAWGDGVVPLRVELVALDVEACHLRVADLDPLGVAARVEDAVHCQPCRGRGRGNQVDDGRMARERVAAPTRASTAEPELHWNRRSRP